jgi:tRNA dimethylallyltransferase
MEIDPDEAMKHPPQNIRFIIRALEIYEKTGQTKTTLATPCPPERPLLMIGIRRDKESTNRLINRRIHQMRNNGLAEEAQRLLDEGYDSELNSMRGIGYGEVIPYLQDEYDRDRAIELMKRHTHRLAKKQRTWFRKYLADAKTSTDPRIQHHIISLE